MTSHTILLAVTCSVLACSTGCSSTANEEEINMQGTVGTQAPDVSLQLHAGNVVKLSDFQGKQSVVLFFYPKDNTPVCTAEACSFRDAYSNFKSLDAVIIGISSDTPKSHNGFAEKYNLPFPLASDPHGELRKAFQVPRTLGIMPGRTTFVIDRSGIIRLAFSAQFSAAKHVEKARDTLRSIHSHD